MGTAIDRLAKAVVAEIQRAEREQLRRTEFTTMGDFSPIELNKAQDAANEAGWIFGHRSTAIGITVVLTKQ